MKKALFVAACLMCLVLVPLLAGGTQEKAEKKVTLNAIAVNDPFWVELTKLVGDFEAKTGIAINMEGVGYDEAYNKITLDLSSHSANYDIVGVDTPWCPEFSEAGFLADLGPFFQKSKTELKPQDLMGIGAGEWKGVQTALPISPYIAITYYRPDLFADSGLSVPKTWEELYKTGKKLTRDVNGDGTVDQWGFAFGNAKGTCITQFWEMQFLSSGGQFWKNAKAGDFTPQLDTGLARKVTERFKRLLEIAPKDNITFDWFDQVNAFSQGRVALVNWWDVFSGDFENKEKSVIGGKWAASDSLSEDGTLGPWIGPWMFAISKDSKHPEEAWKFMKWALSEETQRKLAATGATPPSVLSVLRDPAFQKISPTADVLVKQMAKGALTWPYVKQSAKIEEEIMGLRLNQYMIGELSLDEAMSLMQQEVLAVMKK
jgi:multiple sugar transport system substrate-binding protein